MNNNKHTAPTQKVAMLVLNPCTNDSRVIKQAEELAANKLDVRVYCTRGPNADRNEVKRGVTYIRFQLSLNPFVFIKKINIRKHSNTKKTSTADEVIGEQRENTTNKKNTKSFYRRIRNRIIFPLKFFIFLPFIGKELHSWKPNVIHCHDLNTLPTGVLLSKITKSKVVYDAHEMEQHRNPPLSKVQRFYVACLERYFGRKANAVITVSDEIAEFLKVELRKPKIHTIYNSPITGYVVYDQNIRLTLGLKKEQP